MSENQEIKIVAVETEANKMFCNVCGDCKSVKEQTTLKSSKSDENPKLFPSLCKNGCRSKVNAGDRACTQFVQNPAKLRRKVM